MGSPSVSPPGLGGSRPCCVTPSCAATWRPWCSRRGDHSGQITPAQLEAVEDRSIEAALEGQKRAGIDVYTDGEFRRIVYLTSLVQAVDGLVMEKSEPLP